MRISDWSSDVCSSDLESPSASLKKNPCSAVFHGPGCSRPTNSTSVTHVHRARSVGQRNFPPLPRPILHCSDDPSRSTAPCKQTSASRNWGYLPGPISTREPCNEPKSKVDDEIRLEYRRMRGERDLTGGHVLNAFASAGIAW